MLRQHHFLHLYLNYCISVVTQRSKTLECETRHTFPFIKQSDLPYSHSVFTVTETKTRRKATRKSLRACNGSQKEVVPLENRS